MVLSMCIPLHLDDVVAQTNIIEYLSVIVSGQTDLWLTVRDMSILLMVLESQRRTIVIQLAFTPKISGHMASVILLTINLLSVCVLT